MQLAPIDWIILVGFLLVIVGIGLSYTRASGKNLTSFFLGGRNMPWYLAGVSMVATTFAADTPLAVADLTGSSGISGNWLWWNMLFGGLLTTFFFARLWRRAEVLTEVEFIELRYTGPVAAFLRGFKSIYLGVFLNVLVIGWVSQAMISILSIFLGVDAGTAMWITFGLMAFTAGYSALAGLTGIAVTDGIQFVFAMISTIILAVVVVQSPEVGGMSGLRENLPAGSLQFFPELHGASDGMGVGTVLSITVGAFFARVGMQWWASWYPGAEPGGGGYVAQRMMATKTEKDSVWASLFFNVAHYCIRPWPWVLVGLAAIVLYSPDSNMPKSELGNSIAVYIEGGGSYGELLSDPADLAAKGKSPAVVALAEQLAGSDDEQLIKSVRYGDSKQLGFVFAMTDFLPVGLTGLLLAAFIAAFMSTISTQLNWGASYLVNDFYARFIGPKNASDSHLVWIGRLATLLLMVISLFVASSFSSITAIWEFLIECGAGLGLVLILRWYWWRINAWSELVATIGSMVFFGIALVLNLDFPNSFLFIVGCTTALWISVTFITSPENPEHLQAFVRKVKPAGAWSAVRRAAGVEDPDGNLWILGLAWLMAVGMVYSALFFSGVIILGTGSLLWGAAMIGFGAVLVFLVSRYKLFDS